MLESRNQIPDRERERALLEEVEQARQRSGTWFAFHTFTAYIKLPELLKTELREMLSLNDTGMDPILDVPT